MKILCYNGLRNDGSPELTLIADSAIMREGRPVFVPDFVDEWNSVIMPAIRISRLGLNIQTKFASRYYDAVAAVHLLTPRQPFPENSVIHTSFDGAFAIGEWLNIPDYDSCSLTVNGDTVSTDDFKSASADVIASISKFMTLKNGDIIAFRNLAIVHDATINSVVKASLNGSTSLDFKLK
jgi:2-keto-4-pentenoate hydratase/2-oxohepta-3-ene-1,7-dioic acid hydratase in catechol pathway